MGAERTAPTCGRVQDLQQRQHLEQRCRSASHQPVGRSTPHHTAHTWGHVMEPSVVRNQHAPPPFAVVAPPEANAALVSLIGTFDSLAPLLIPVGVPSPPCPQDGRCLTGRRPPRLERLLWVLGLQCPQHLYQAHGPAAGLERVVPHQVRRAHGRHPSRRAVPLRSGSSGDLVRAVGRTGLVR